MNIGVVIVTYNRLEKLKKALESFDNQIVKPKYIIVVNNKSTDNTKEYLEQWKKLEKEYKKYIIETEENLGGAGGFYTGLKKSLELDADWVYVSDDDAFPEKDVIEKAENFLNEYKDREELAAICTKILRNGKTDYFHRASIKKRLFSFKITNSKEEDYQKDFFEINLFTYVGTILNKEYLEKYGITRKDFFIFTDDWEHSYRLSKHGKILCIPSITVRHNTENAKGEDWRIYYAKRNTLIWYKSFGKRYFYYAYFDEKIRLIAKKILKYKIETHEPIRQALKDAKKGILWKSEKFMPGR